MSTTESITPSAAHRGPGATVSILTWFLTVAVVLSVVARLGFRFNELKLRARDDMALCIAGVFHIAQCVAVSFEADAGLGRHEDTLSADGLVRFEKANYAADVLFIPTLCMAQTSAFLLVESIPASKIIQDAVRYTSLVNFVWSIVATLCVVFRSHISEVWSTPATGVNMHVLWTMECVIAILVEVVLVAVPFWVIAPLQATRTKRTTILVSFSFRIFVIAAIVVHIAITPSSDTLRADITRNLAEPVISSQAVLSSAIIMTSIPVLSRFLDQFETGMLRINEDQTTVGGTRSGSNHTESFKMASLTSRTHVTVATKPRYIERLSEGDERGESREMLEPIPRTDDQRKTRRRSKSSENNGIMINRSWELQYERSEEVISDDERLAPVAEGQ